MDFERLLRVFRKWFWLVILAMAVGAGITILSSANRTFTYQAQTKVLIGGFIGSTNPSRGEIETGSVLAETYVELISTPLILQGVIDELGLDTDVTQLKRVILAGKPSGPPIIVIQAYANDPDMAVRMANETARQLVAKSPTNLTPAQQAQIDLAREQINLLNQQVQDAQAEIIAIDERLGDDPNAATQISPLTQQRNALAAQINQASANIAQFSATIASIEQRTNRLTIIEEAETAIFFSTGPGLLESTIISAITGAILASVAIVGIDYLDSTIRSSKDATSALNAPVLGTIPQLGKRSAPYHQRLVTNWSQRSAIAESYRALQTNLLAAHNGSGHAVYIITSPGEHEGKSVTTANLAVTMALNGLNVLLIDADMVKPRVHEFFNLDNDRGLKTLISVNPAVVSHDDLDKPVSQLNPNVQQTLNLLGVSVQNTPVQNLRVITSGPVTDNSTHLSEYNSLRDWLPVLYTVLGVDVILFDTPPCLVVSDASILASLIPASCVLVVQSGRTNRDAAVRAQTQFMHIGKTFAGVVLNRVKNYDMDHGYNSGYFKQSGELRTATLLKPDPRVLMNGAASENKVRAEQENK
jgi:protein-tyrosine kinase